MAAESKQYWIDVAKKELAILQYLTDIVNRECFYDDVSNDLCVEDYAGGNVDVAFYIGENTGKVMLARKLLEMLSEKE